MGGVVFFDLKSKELSVYAFGKNGKAGSPSEILSIPVGEGCSFRIETRANNGTESLLSLPLDLLNFRVVELPFSDIGKVRELLPFELDSLVLGGAGKVIFDASVLGEQNGKTKVLVTYIEKDLLRPLLDRLRQAGFDPKAVTSIELAAALESPSSGQELTELLVAPRQLSDSERTEAAAKEIGSPTVNLRTGEFAYTADSDRTKRRWRITAVLAALVMLLFIANMASVSLILEKRNGQLRDSIRRTYVSLFPGEKKITDETYQLKAHIRELKEKESSFIGVSPLSVLLELSKVGTSGTALTEISVERGMILVKGESPSMSDVQKFRNELENVFRDVTISDTKPSLQNKSTLFTITAKEKDR